MSGSSNAGKSHDSLSRGPESEKEYHGVLDHAVSVMNTHADVFDARAVTGAPSHASIMPATDGALYGAATPIPSTFVPPLYFQHQGHSRTIVGILKNLRTHRFRLIVLDTKLNVKKALQCLLLNSAYAYCSSIWC